MSNEYGTKEWWDDHRAGKYGGFKGGYSSTDDPYLGYTPEMQKRDETRRHFDEENARFYESQRRNAEADREWLKNLSPEERAEIIRRREEERRRAEYYSGMTSEQRSRAISAEAELSQFQREQEEREAFRLEREQKRNAFKDAKARYSKLSMFTRLKLSMSGKSPNKIDISNMTTQDINGLYGGRRRWMKS